MKKILLLFVLLLLIVGGLVFSQNYFKQGKLSFFNANKNVPSKNETVTIGNHKFGVVVAKSQPEWETGLSQTESLQDNQGMLFLFEKSDYHFFWMRNMKFPIDIIYINNDTIVTIKNNVQLVKDKENPIIYSSIQPADKVLEIQAGLSEKYKFKNGDKIKYENLGN